MEGATPLSVYLDTHVVLWLHDREQDRLSPEARRVIERGKLRVSPAVVLELELLREIGRLAMGARFIISRLSAQNVGSRPV